MCLRWVVERSTIKLCVHILDHNYLLQKGLIWTLGNGKSISFWIDNWIEDSSQVDKIIPNMRNTIVDTSKVSDFVTPQKIATGHLDNIFTDDIILSY